MPENNLPLSSQFKIELLRRSVEENPEKALDLVLKYYQEYSKLYQQYKALQKAHLKYRNGIFM